MDEKDFNKNYEFLEHTGDAKFRAYGNTLEERFINAALAMSSIIVDFNEIKPDIQKNIDIEGNDIKQLLYNWLQEILFLLDADGFFLNKVDEIEIIKEKERLYRLKAVIAGDTLKEDYLVYGSVKAATYAEMEIRNDFIQVVVDI